MFSSLLNRIRGTRTVTNVTNVFNNTSDNTSGFLYAVTLPGQQPVMLRAQNQVEVKRLVREAHGITRLPAGTTVERMT